MASIRDLIEDGIEFEGRVIVEFFHSRADSENIEVLFDGDGCDLTDEEYDEADWLDMDISYIYTPLREEYPHLHVQFYGE